MPGLDGETFCPGACSGVFPRASLCAHPSAFSASSSHPSLRRNAAHPNAMRSPTTVSAGDENCRRARAGIPRRTAGPSERLASATVPATWVAADDHRKAIRLRKVSLLEVFVWFPASEIMVLSQQGLQVGTRVRPKWGSYRGDRTAFDVKEIPRRTWRGS